MDNQMKHEKKYCGNADEFVSVCKQNKPLKLQNHLS